MNQEATRPDAMRQNPLTPDASASARSVAETFPPPQADTQAETARDPIAEFAELTNWLAERAQVLLTIKIDTVRVTVREALVKAGLGVVGFFALIGTIFISVFLLLTGVSFLLSRALGDRLWLANLIVGLLTLTGIVVLIRVGLGKFRTAGLEKLRMKYASRHV